MALSALIGGIDTGKKLCGRHGKLVVFVALALLAVALNARFGWTELFANPESLPVLRRALRENLAQAILIYVAATAVGCVVLALPGVVFAIAAGVLFGPLWGTVACLLGATVGSCFAFLAARYLLRDAVKPLLMKNKHIRRVLFEESRENGLFLLALTRLVPIFPYNLQNFAYGVTDIRFWPYAVYSFLFMLPGTAAYVVAAAGVSGGENRLLYFGAAAVLLAAVTAVSFRLKKRHVPDEKGNHPIEQENL
jgi:uncharacterized membrane protein YdjX (TVP38/TMEM64 family)